MTLRVAVIGVGRMGTNHVRVIRQLDECELVAIAESDAEAAARVARRAGVTAYADHRELLATERVDCVAVAVPTALHRPVAEDCLDAGVHVLLEKPIALDAEDAREIIEAARRSGRQLRIGHVERFNPAVRELRTRLQDGQAGRILQIVARRMSPFQPHIKDHGVGLDLGTHELDVMRFLLGEEPARVFAMARRHIHSEHDDLLVGLIEFEGGAVGVLETNWLTPAKVRDLAVLGQRGMFALAYLSQDLEFYENALVPSRWEGAGDFLVGVGEGRMVRYPIEHVEPLRAEWEAFLAAVEGREADGATGEDALRTVLLADALARSAASGSPIAMRPVPAT